LKAYGDHAHRRKALRFSDLPTLEALSNGDLQHMHLEIGVFIGPVGMSAVERHFMRLTWHLSFEKHRLRERGNTSRLIFY